MKTGTLLLAVFPVLCASVVEKTETYNCAAGSHYLKYEEAYTAHKCEQTWSVETQSVALYQDGKNIECHPPCINVTSGAINISGCVNITLIHICFQGYLTEHRIHFLGIMIKLSPIENSKGRCHYGVFISIALLCLICVGLAVQSIKSQACGFRNSGTEQHETSNSLLSI